MTKIEIKNRPRQVPLWLRRLGLVKAELKSARYPRNAEEGLREAAALSAINLRLLQAAVRSGLARADGKRVEMATRHWLARLSHADARRIPAWKRERARYFGR